MVTDKEKKVIQAYVDAYNHFDLPTMLSCLDENVVFQKVAADVVDTETVGIAAFKALAEETEGLYSSRELKILGWDKKAQKVIVRINCHVTLNVDLPSGLKTGSPLDIRDVFEFVVRDGKIAEIIDRS
ncbi:MAG: nuclear transport factor 2 family protein [Exilibacterium sp.]